MAGEHHAKMEAHFNNGLARQDNRRMMEAAIVALVAEFIGELTGLRPPLERSLFPPHWTPALNRLCDGLMQVVKETHAPSPQPGPSAEQGG